MMKKTYRNISSILLLVSTLLSITGCQKDKLSDISVVETQWNETATNELDEWIEKRFNPYNIQVLYRWDKSNLPPGMIAYPPSPDKIKPVLGAVDALLFRTYSSDKAGGRDFFKDKGIIRMTLIGGYNTTNDGVLLQLWSEAAASNELFIFGVNEYDPQDPKSVYRLLKSIHHQFAKRLTEAIPYDRDAFSTISSSSYGSLALAPSAEEAYDRIGLSPYANRRGFYTLHSMYNPDDDFAEIVSVLMQHSAVEILDAEHRAETPFDPTSSESIREAEKAYRALVTKRAFVEKYFKENVGISIRKLQLQSLQNIAEYNKAHSK